MRRAPGSSSPGFSPAVVLVVLLAIVVVGGTAYGYQQWQDDIAAATATDTTNPGASSGGGLPSAPSSDEASKDAKGGKGDDDKADPYEPPTFDVLEPTDNRPQPVVLLVGDGYADGRGASSPSNSYASLISKELGWDVRLATAPGAGYLSGNSLLDLFTDSPDSVDPDLVIPNKELTLGEGAIQPSRSSTRPSPSAIPTPTSSQSARSGRARPTSRPRPASAPSPAHGGRTPTSWSCAPNPTAGPPSTRSTAHQTTPATSSSPPR